MQHRALALAFSIAATLALPVVVSAQGVDAGSEEVAAAQQELQGRSNAANSSACASCSTAGSPSDVPPLVLFGATVAFAAYAHRRRRP